MKLKFLAALALSAVLLLSGCAAPAQNETTPESSSAAPETTAVSERVITDSYGTKTELPDDPCVVSLYGSFAECWLLSGGKPAGSNNQIRLMFPDYFLGIAESVKNSFNRCQGFQ